MNANEVYPWMLAGYADPDASYPDADPDATWFEYRLCFYVSELCPCAVMYAFNIWSTRSKGEIRYYAWIFVEFHVLTEEIKWSWITSHNQDNAYLINQAMGSGFNQIIILSNQNTERFMGRIAHHKTYPNKLKCL